MNNANTQLDANKNKQYGITSPISLAEPKAHDLSLTSSLDQKLHEYGIFETQEEIQHR